MNRYAAQLADPSFPTQPVDAPQPAGVVINVIGPMAGLSARIAALRSAGVTVLIQDHRTRHLETAPLIELFDIIDAESTANPLPELQAGVYRIGCISERFDRRQLGAMPLDRFSELWVPSRLAFDQLSQRSALPLMLMPPPLPVETIDQPAARGGGRGVSPLVFAAFADCTGGVQSTAVFSVIAAFKKAFTQKSSVRLLVHCTACGATDLHQLRRAIGAGRSITLVEDDTESIADVIARCQAVISLPLHRAFDTTLAAAMAAGKLILAVEGSAEGLTDRNSVVLQSQRPPVDKSTMPVLDLADITQALKRVASQFTKLKPLALQGQRDARRLWEATGIGRRMSDRLVLLQSRRGNGRLMASSTAVGQNPREEYLGMIPSLRDWVQSLVPAGATVAIISKGDPELIRFSRQIGRHFPHDEQGNWSGFHPADSAAAIAALEESRAGGTQFLVIPKPSLWWLDHYADFAKHLQAYTMLASSPAGIVFQLTPAAAEDQLRQISLRVDFLLTALGPLLQQARQIAARPASVDDVPDEQDSASEAEAPPAEGADEEPPSVEAAAGQMESPSGEDAAEAEIRSELSSLREQISRQGESMVEELGQRDLRLDEIEHLREQIHQLQADLGSLPVQAVDPAEALVDQTRQLEEVFEWRLEQQRQEFSRRLQEVHERLVRQLEEDRREVRFELSSVDTQFEPMIQARLQPLLDQQQQHQQLLLELRDSLQLQGQQLQQRTLKLEESIAAAANAGHDELSITMESVRSKMELDQSAMDEVLSQLTNLQLWSEAHDQRVQTISAEWREQFTAAEARLEAAIAESMQRDDITRMAVTQAVDQQAVLAGDNAKRAAEIASIADRLVVDAAERKKWAARGDVTELIKVVQSLAGQVIDQQKQIEKLAARLDPQAPAISTKKLK